MSDGPTVRNPDRTEEEQSALAVLLLIAEDPGLAVEQRVEAAASILQHERGASGEDE